jgi:hypothetical protein
VISKESIHCFFGEYTFVLPISIILSGASDVIAVNYSKFVRHPLDLSRSWWIEKRLFIA